jgi:outer membrane lipoprotein-sorting protein
LLLAFPAAFAAAEPLQAILSRMDVSAKTANSFSANLKSMQYTKVLDSTDSESGTIKLRRVKGRVMGRMDTETPAPKTWHFAGDTWEHYVPKAKSVSVYKVSKIAKSADQYLLLVFGVSGSELMKDFDAKGGAEETIGGVRATRLELIPKDKKAREYAAKVELWIPVGQTYAIQQKVTEPNGNYTMYSYTDAKLNPALPDSAFTFTAPAGTHREVAN